MKCIKLVLLVAFVLALAGCGDDDYNGGGDSGGNYSTYWGIIETIAVEGDVTNMTQKPEAPAPAGDQEECPGVTAVASLILVAELCFRDRPYRLKGFGSRRPLDKCSKRLVVSSFPPSAS